jgi:transcriptional regulator with XRE-family HTH domain
MVESPVRRVRREMGLSQIEFAALCGISHGAVTFAESGVGGLPRAIAETLRAHGFDVARLAAEHETFRRARAVELAERVRSRRAERTECDVQA